LKTIRQFLEQFDKGAAIHEFWKVCSLYKNEAWWDEMNLSSLPAIPVSREIPSLLRLALMMYLP